MTNNNVSALSLRDCGRPRRLPGPGRVTEKAWQQGTEGLADVPAMVQRARNAAVLSDPAFNGVLLHPGLARILRGHKFAFSAKATRVAIIVAPHMCVVYDVQTGEPKTSRIASSGKVFNDVMFAFDHARQEQSLILQEEAKQRSPIHFAKSLRILTYGRVPSSRYSQTPSGIQSARHSQRQTLEQLL